MNMYNDTGKSSNSNLSGESIEMENCWNGNQQHELNVIKSKCQTYVLVGAYIPPVEQSKLKVNHITCNS